MDFTECNLDHHFSMQLRVIGNVYKNKNLKKQDYILSQHWIQHFRQAPGQEKYARNCLMLLMYGQLKEMGRLGKPFTEKNNSKRNLDAILCEYNGKMDDDDDDNNIIHINKDNANILTIVTRRDDTTKSGPIYKPDVQQDKDKSLGKLNKSQLEKDTKNQIIYLQQQIPKQIKTFEYQKIVGKNQKLMTNIWQSVLQGINCLKTWTGPDDQINFISICFQQFATPEMKDNLTILDRRFERILNDIAQEACERHEKNVLILLEQLSKQQHKLFLANKEYNRRLQNYEINRPIRQQKTHKDFLKERDQMLRQQETISKGISTLIACNHYSNKHSLELESGSKPECETDTKDAKEGDELVIPPEGQQPSCNGRPNAGQQNEKKEPCTYCQGKSS